MFSRDPDYEYTLLHYVIRNGWLKGVQILLTMGTSLNQYSRALLPVEWALEYTPKEVEDLTRCASAVSRYYARCRYKNSHAT